LNSLGEGVCRYDPVTVAHDDHGAFLHLVADGPHLRNVLGADYDEPPGKLFAASGRQPSHGSASNQGAGE
jgi:hypothetical protein